jgi:hypothetical protein
MEDLNELRAVEKECLKKFVARARKIHAANPALSMAICRGRAIQEMPRTAEKFLQARATLTMAGSRPILFSDIE